MNVLNDANGAKRRLTIYAFAMLALLSSAPARAGHWEISYRVGGGVAYSEENHEPTQGLVSSDVSGNPTGLDTQTNRTGRAPWAVVAYDPSQPMSSTSGAGGSFLFESGFVRADTKVDGSITTVLDWVADEPTDRQPPPDVVEIKESALARASGFYSKHNSYEDNGVVDSWIADVSNGLDAAVQSSPNAQPEPHGVDTAWKEASSEKNLAIANPARLSRVVLPTRNLRASSRSGMTKPMCFYGENWGANAISRVQYQVEPGPKPFWVNLVDGVRACAGGVADDGVHSATVTATSNRPNEPVTFAFDTGAINYTGLKLPKFVVNGVQQDEYQTTTDANGKVDLRVLSSDLISRPRIIAKHPSTEGQMVDVSTLPNGEPLTGQCDFSAAESRRRFGYPLFNEGSKYDTGWEAVTPPGSGSVLHVLSMPGQVVALQLYLKFQKRKMTPSPYSASFTQYNPLPDDDNWQSVNGHTVRVTLAEVARKLPTGESWAPQNEFDDYVTLCDAQSNPQSYVDVLTDVNGVSEKVYVKGGPLIHKVVYFSLRSIDQTQLKR